MFYTFGYTPVITDTAASPHKIEMKLTAGVIHQVDVLFQSGACHEIFVQIFKDATQVWPSNRGESMRGNAILRNKLICTLAEIRFGNIGKAKKHIRSALMIMNDTLETMFTQGIAEKDKPIPDGGYKILVDDIHLLTKKIKGNEGSNHLPWLTRIKLLAWKGLIAKYRLFTGDFKIEWSEGLKCWLLIYKDGRIVDRVRFVRGQDNVLVGCFYYEGRLEFWFLMRKSN